MGTIERELINQSLFLPTRDADMRGAASEQ